MAASPEIVSDMQVKETLWKGGQNFREKQPPPQKSCEIVVPVNTPVRQQQQNYVQVYKRTVRTGAGKKPQQQTNQ